MLVNKARARKYSLCASSPIVTTNIKITWATLNALHSIKIEIKKTATQDNVIKSGIIKTGRPSSDRPIIAIKKTCAAKIL